MDSIHNFPLKTLCCWAERYKGPVKSHCHCYLSCWVLHKGLMHQQFEKVDGYLDCMNMRTLQNRMIGLCKEVLPITVLCLPKRCSEYTSHVQLFASESEMHNLEFHAVCRRYLPQTWCNFGIASRVSAPH
jgi:hypothetical protein